MFLFQLRPSVYEIKSQEFPATLKLKAELSSGTLVCPTYKRELRHIPQDCNYISEYLKPQNLTCLLAAIHGCPQNTYTKHRTEKWTRSST